MGNQTLDTLIAKIKSEAIEAADLEAKKILKQARVQAQKITDEAEANRESILFTAQKEAQATLFNEVEKFFFLIFKIFMVRLDIIPIKKSLSD